MVFFKKLMKVEKTTTLDAEKHTKHFVPFLVLPNSRKYFYNITNFRSIFCCKHFFQKYTFHQNHVRQLIKLVSYLQPLTFLHHQVIFFPFFLLYLGRCTPDFPPLNPHSTSEIVPGCGSSLILILFSMGNKLLFFRFTQYIEKYIWVERQNTKDLNHAFQKTLVQISIKRWSEKCFFLQKIFVRSSSVLNPNSLFFVLVLPSRFGISPVNFAKKSSNMRAVMGPE